jgi:periplasmic copper chaperone A
VNEQCARADGARVSDSARSRSLLAFLAAGTILTVTSASAAEIALKNAWARPMAKGYPVAAIYVDIRSDVALKLVGASSPVAKSIGIVSAGIKPDGSDETPKEVRELDIAAGRDTRLALNGDYLELRDVLEDKGAGATIPLRLDFIDAAGKPHSAKTEAVVRGITLQPPPPAAVPLKAQAAKP